MQANGTSSRPLTVTGSAIANHYSYTAVNDGSKLQTMEHDGSGGMLMAFGYSYDTLGRITNSTETNSEGVTSWNYSYDGSGRLTTATQQGSFNHSYVYTYDGAGNRTSEQIDGVTSTESANSVNQLTNQSGTSTSISYDLAGNETTKVWSGGGFVFDWDGANRCTAIGSSDSQFGIAYDGLNRWTHITQCDSDCTNLLADRWFVWNGTTLTEERDGSGTLIQRFYANGFWRAGTNYFYIRDHLGSVRQVIDQNGTIVAKFEYDPYGRRTQTFGTMWVDYGYAGLFELPNGLKLAVWRIYDPSTGRWINRDPIQESGGWNLYAYCGGDPIGATDENGLIIDTTALSSTDLNTYRANVSYLMRSATFKAAYTQMSQNQDVTIHIVMTGADKPSGFLWTNQTVYWNPLQVAKSISVDGQKFVLSQSIGIAHELGHAYHYSQCPASYPIYRQKTLLPEEKTAWGNFEEVHNIMLFEWHIDKDLGLPLRLNHQ